MNLGTHYAHWDVIAMYVSILVIMGFEFLGVFSKEYITITHIVRQYIPLWLRWMFWGWMGWHFLLK